MTLVRQQIRAVALERSLRGTTVRSYETLIARLGIVDRDVSSIGREEALELVWEIENPNTRRSTVIALRSVLGLDLKVPKGIARRYELPDEDTLRMAAMLTPHEIRMLLMMYGGLRVGEACAITGRDVYGDRLTVDKQVIEGTNKIGPVKSTEGSVVIPWWLSERLDGLGATETAKPASVRESMRRADKKVGIALNPHLCRHWYASHLLAKGVPLIVVSRQLRHSDPSVTLRTYAQANDATEIHELLG